MNLNGAWTLITGGTSGIGEATADLFASEGSNLVILGRDSAKLNKIASRIRNSHGVDVRTIVSDVRNYEETMRHLHDADDEVRFDVAIINHGIGQFGRVAKSPWEDIEPVLSTNIHGSIAVASAVSRGMATRKSGSIIFISTILDKRPIPNHAAYSASKSALRTFANVLRMEVKQLGIHVGVVSPARTRTGFADRVRYSETPGRSAVNISAPPATAAETILRCVRGKHREITVSLTGKAYVFFGYHFPRLSDWLIQKIVPIPSEKSTDVQK